MRSPLLLALVALAALAPAASASDDPAQLAAAVARDVVHVEPRAAKRVSTAEAGRLRIRIVQRDPGRIKILVVPGMTAERNGGIAKLSNAVFTRAGLRGALMVVAGPQVWITTSYDSGPALTAVQQAIAAHDGKRLAPALLDSVDRLARVDPGPGADEGANDLPAGLPGVSGDGGFGKVIDDIGDAIRTVIFGVGGLIALLLLIPIGISVRRVWRDRSDNAEELELGRTAAREELVRVGELVRELDLDAEMPGADEAGKEALGRAIELYHRVDRDLPKATTSRRLQRARATLAEARQQAELARGRLTAGTAPAGIPSGTGASDASRWNVDT